EEAAAGTLPGALVLPRGLLEKHALAHLPRKDAPIIVYSSTGGRSALAADALGRMGYSQVRSLAGGFEGWKHAGLPISGAESCQLPTAKLTWADVRHQFAIVQRRVPVLGLAQRELVYLDHAASTHAPSCVLASYRDFLEHEYANVHRATHLLSRKATERFEECYYVVADFIGADLRSGAVCFTANTTQAIDLASHVMAHRPGKILTTEMEHHSNELPHRRRGAVLRARVTDSGELDLGHMEELLRKNEVKLVCVTAGSNVTGFIPDLQAVARLAHDNGALLLVDAAQALAHLPINVRKMEDPEHIDFLVGAGHKAYAPFGAGFLYGPRSVLDEASPYLPGGGTATDVTQRGAEFLKAPDRHQGGTPNIAGVVGLARSLQFLEQIGMEQVRQHELGLTRKMLAGLQADGAILYGPLEPEKRLGVVSFNVAGIADLLTAAVLSEEGAVAVRNGRFCSHIYVDRLLSAAHRGQTGTPAPQGAVRASVGLYNDETDVDRLIEYVKRVQAHQWQGHYRVKGDTVSAEFAGRCADRWMESTPEADIPIPDLGSSFGYEFEILQPEGECRSYLIADAATGEAAIVDQLRQKVDGYVELLNRKRWRLRYTIETHTHADHLSGSARLKDLTGAKMLMHAESTATCVDRPLRDGDAVELGALKMEIIGTPGHTRDGMCIVLPGRVLTGDTLLIGACGRTDLPTGSAQAMFESMQRLSGLPDDLLVFPAHDYDGRKVTTIGHERKTNPRMKIQTATDFDAALRQSLLPLPLGMDDILDTNNACR
ncbi:MAG TPA: aminotransferase class V-fold PLP-dependent enzyme, partial [Myxococcaceae bacterium]|nr:aminotransferase class V-fold PLP-dependent enzyme [Myxococcaceae bacterium]